jgi:hypothetical protein
MELEELKDKLQKLIKETNNEILLEDLLSEAESRININTPYQTEGLTEEDFNELTSLVSEPSIKDTISYDELKSSLSRWFSK